MRVLWFTVACVVTAAQAVGAYAQNASVRFEIRSDGASVADASVVVNGAAHRTDAAGILALDLPAGRVDVVVAKEAFAPASVTF
jgi:hypothetical protein